MTKAKLSLDGKDYEFPVLVGSEDEVGIDFTTLRKTTGAISLDPGYGNTGSCTSTITFINGEKGILQYRGYPIEEVAASASFEEVCFLLIYGHLPSVDELAAFHDKLIHHSMIHEAMKDFFQDFPPTAHPMMVLSAMVASLSAYYTRGAVDEDVAGADAVQDPAQEEERPCELVHEAPLAGRPAVRFHYSKWNQHSGRYEVGADELPLDMSKWVVEPPAQAIADAVLGEDQSKWYV